MILIEEIFFLNQPACQTGLPGRQGRGFPTFPDSYRDSLGRVRRRRKEVP
jgi:hypothetical protein